MQRLYAFHVWFWLQTIFSCKVKSPSLALSVALSWNWGDLTGVPGVSTDSIIKAITSKHSKHKWDFTTATWAKEQGHQVGYNSIPFWKVHHFALWNHHSTVSAPTMCYPVSIQQAHFRQILCWWQREPVFHIASGMGSWDQWIHFREGYVPPNTWQDSLHWGREFFVPSFVLKQLSWFYQVGSTMSNWRSIHPGDWWGTGEYSMESSSWPAGTLSYMHQQGVMQVVIYTSCKQGKLQFDANTVNTCKAHRTLEARWGQHDISTCCISALSLWVTHQKQIW